MWYVYSCQMEDSIRICCGMSCPLTQDLKKSMHGVLLMRQSLRRWKAALLWTSREVVALTLRSSRCLLVATSLSLRIKPQQGSPTFNFLAKVSYIHSLLQCSHSSVDFWGWNWILYVFGRCRRILRRPLWNARFLQCSLSSVNVFGFTWNQTPSHGWITVNTWHFPYPFYMNWVVNAKSLHYKSGCIWWEFLFK